MTAYSKKPIFLDYSATTPVDPRVVEAMLPYWTEAYGNPSSSHSYGRAANQGLEESRRSIARILNAHPSEIIFTGCGSEADNMALRGAMWAARQEGRGNHMITSVIEHEAILATAHQLNEVFGFDLTVVGVDEDGRVDPAEVEAAIRPDTVLISIMAANNEIGTIQPIMEIGELARQHGALFHSDAVQAAAIWPWDMETQPVDMLTLAAHKFYGPKGVGILYLRRGVNLVSSLTGGSQEEGRRAGTSNVAFAVGAAKALEIATETRQDYLDHCIPLRDRLIAGVLEQFSPADCQLTGHREDRLPYHTSFVFNGLTGSDILMHLDLLGIAGSSGSACSSGNPAPSKILESLGLGETWTRGGLRLTLGRQTTAAQIDYVIEHVPQAINWLRSFTAVYS